MRGGAEGAAVSLRVPGTELYVLCAGVLMVVLDSTIAVVALPAILTDLHLSDSTAIWVLNAYLLTYGGFLLLGGRLGDVIGRRRVFLASVAAFTLASAVCGLAYSIVTLLLARAIQGIAGALITSVALSLIAALFRDPVARARAMGFYGFVYAVGGSAGELLGGILTNALGWHWIFLINLPVGLLVCGVCAHVLPEDEPLGGRRLDISGSIIATSALALTLYLLGRIESFDETLGQTRGLLGAIGILLTLFIVNELRAREPLIPLRLFLRRNFLMANALALIWAGAAYGWFTIAALQLQRVLGCTPLQIGLAFVPSTLLCGAFSLGVAGRMVARFGIRGPIWVGLLLFAAGLVLFSRINPGASFATEVLPGMLIIGLADGIASTPLLLAAMNDVDEADSGIASGVINTCWIVGGAIGVAILVSITSIRTSVAPEVSGRIHLTMNQGYQFAYLASAVVTFCASILAAVSLRSSWSTTKRVRLTDL